jgi:hypothetical protein
MLMRPPPPSPANEEQQLVYDSMQVSHNAMPVPFTRYLSTLMRPSPTDEDRQLAYDSMQVLHDATPVPIPAQQGPSVPLSTLSFSSPEPPGRATGRCPSLLHLSVFLLTIHAHFLALYSRKAWHFTLLWCATAPQVLSLPDT